MEKMILVTTGAGRECYQHLAGKRPGLLLTFYKALDSPREQRIIWPKMPVVLKTMLYSLHLGLTPGIVGPI